MASVQVLKKQGHLEAGKKKLEEFRRKKAAEKAKMTTSASQAHVSDVINEKQTSEDELVRFTDSNGVGNSEALEGRLQPSCSDRKIATKEFDISSKSDSSTDTNGAPSLSARNNDIKATVPLHSHLNNGETKETATSVGLDGLRSATDKFRSIKDDSGSLVQVASGFGNDYFFHNVSSIQENQATRLSTHHGLDKYPSNNIDGHEKDLSVGNSGTFADSTATDLPMNSASSPFPDKLGISRNEAYNLEPMSYQGDKRFADAVDHIGSLTHSSSWTADYRYTDYNYDARSLLNHATPSLPAAGRRSRPSFLDSIQISKGTSPSPPLFGTEKADTSSTKVYLVDGFGSSVSQISVDTSAASANGVGLLNHTTENKHEFFPQKQNEDFAALEQVVIVDFKGASEIHSQAFLLKA